MSHLSGDDIFQLWLKKNLHVRKQYQEETSSHQPTDNTDSKPTLLQDTKTVVQENTKPALTHTAITNHDHTEPFYPENLSEHLEKMDKNGLPPSVGGATYWTLLTS